MSVKTLNAGLDLTALFGSYAAAIQQAIEESYPILLTLLEKRCLPQLHQLIRFLLFV